MFGGVKTLSTFMPANIWSANVSRRQMCPCLCGFLPASLYMKEHKMGRLGLQVLNGLERWLLRRGWGDIVGGAWKVEGKGNERAKEGRKVIDA